jgi:prepilin signal peptidase PulO-like enzyme (type II secretory pathway)
VTEAHLWVLASAPFCGAFAVRASDAEISDIGGTRHSITYNVIRIGGVATLASLGALAAPTAMAAVASVVFTCGLAYLALVDVRLLAIPVWPACALTGAGIVFVMLDGGMAEASANTLAAVAGGMVMLTLAALFKITRGVNGLGSGDALLAALIGAYLSWTGLAWSVALGGLLTLAWAKWRAWPSDRHIPFAPGLAAGAYIAMLIQLCGGMRV